MQLSYKIIKKGNISTLEKPIPLVETNFKFVEGDPLDEVLVEEDNGQGINVEEIKEEIQKSLYLAMEKERNEIINNAQIEGDKIRLQSRKQGYKSGYKEGYKEAYKEGMAKVENEGAIIKENALNLIEQSENHVSQYLRENEEQIINLAVDMAESIVHSTIDGSAEDILMLIKPILQSHEKKDSIIVTCHPDNESYLKDQLEELKGMSPTSRFIILSDSNIEKNGCIIENEHQVIDLQIKKQIESILDEIRNLE